MEMCRIYVLLSICLLLNVSCESLNNYAPPGFDPEVLAVSALIDPLTGLEVVVGRTIPPNSSGEVPIQSLYVNDAIVELTTSTGERLNVQGVGEGRYRFKDDSIIVEKACFRLTVEHNDFPIIYSQEVCIPVSTAVTDFSSEEIMDENLGFIIPRVTFNIQDTPEGFYYKIDVTNKDSGTRTSIICETPINLDFCQFFDYHDPYGIYFTDACFIDTVSQFQIDLQSNRSVQGENPEEGANLRIATITEAYFKYLANFQNLDDDRGWIVEPVSSFTNLEGGIGVFAASNSIQRSVFFP